MPARRLPSVDHRRRAFSLVELIAVMVVLGILAAVAAPRFFDLSDDARISAAVGARAALQEAVRQAYYASAAAGEAAYPASIAFALQGDESKHLYNPWWEPGIPVYIDDPRAGPEKLYVQTKTLDNSPGRGAYGSGAIWYNPTNGRVNFRVPDQGSSSATLALFNRVNGADVTQMRQTTD